jgi:hypothetical protein
VLFFWLPLLSGIGAGHSRKQRKQVGKKAKHLPTYLRFVGIYLEKNVYGVFTEYFHAETPIDEEK